MKLFCRNVPRSSRVFKNYQNQEKRLSRKSATAKRSRMLIAEEDDAILTLTDELKMSHGSEEEVLSTPTS